MTGHVLSPRAQADLGDIWDFTEATWNADQAEKYLRDIGQAFNTIAADPRRGQDAGDIRAGYRKYATGSHVRAWISTAIYDCSAYLNTTAFAQSVVGDALTSKLWSRAPHRFYDQRNGP